MTMIEWSKKKAGQHLELYNKALDAGDDVLASKHQDSYLNYTELSSNVKVIKS